MLKRQNHFMHSTAVVTHEQQSFGDNAPESNLGHFASSSKRSFADACAVIDDDGGALQTGTDNGRL